MTQKPLQTPAAASSPSESRFSDEVTVVVFKDNLAARALRVPLSWIARLGVGMGVLVLLTLFSLLLAGRYYWVSRASSPQRVHDLEQELQDLRAVLASKGTVPAASVAAPAASPIAPIAEPTVAARPSAAVPADVPSIPLVMAPAAITTGTRIAHPFLFAALPLQTQVVDPSTVPIGIQGPKATWQGNTLAVYFAIQYQKPDRGNQQGRIVILARGSESLLAYPEALFSRPDAESLISIDQGEYFSVSRFREVRAQFGPVASRESIKDVEILLFNENGQILIYQKLFPETAAPSGRAPKPQKSTKTPASGTSSEGSKESLQKESPKELPR